MLPQLLGLILTSPCLLVLSSGKTIPVKRWRVLGPFPVGKNELDGQPWLLSNHSELVRGAAVSWKKLIAGNDGTLEADFRQDVDWQGVVNGVGGHEVLEWQALAQGSLRVDALGLALLSCRGVSAFLLDDSSIPFVGDQYHTGLPGHPVQLTSKHVISVRLRAKMRGAIRCAAEGLAGPKPMVFGGSFLHAPDVVDGVLASDLMAVPVLNANPSAWLRNVQVNLLTGSGAPVGADSQIRLAVEAEQPERAAVAPGQLQRLIVRVVMLRQACPTVRLQAVVSGQFGVADDGPVDEVKSEPFLLPAWRCRKRGQSFVFTFVDGDGSLQHAAAIAPVGSPPSATSSKDVPIVVTLHGTSISASDSADSYKVKKRGDADYSFGVEGAWLLAPTRHGAHNWEGPGRVSALTAARNLLSVTGRLGGPVANNSRLVVAGHSMGGHGAWLLAVAARDVALGVISSASWLRKDQYADSNKVFLHDVALADVEPSLVALLRSAESEHDADAHAAMLAGGMPMLIRVGDKDTTVHPWFSRRMLRSLRAAGASESEVTFSEIPGKEHWWWDTKEENDGGAVNDAQVRRFFSQSLQRKSGAAGLGPAWQLVTFNPATASQKGGLQILQQHVPHRRSSVSVDAAVKRTTATQPVLIVKTSNVRRFSWSTASMLKCLASAASTSGDNAGHHEAVRMDIDNMQLEVPLSASTVFLCQDTAMTWQFCPGHHLPPTERSPETLGPMRQLFTKPACAVVGSNDTAALEGAVYVANLLVMTGHGSLPVLRDIDVVAGSDRSSSRKRWLKPPAGLCEHLLVIGKPEKNEAAATLLSQQEDVGPHGFEPPLKYYQRPPDGAHIQVGPCAWSSGADLAAVALLPWWRLDGTESIAPGGGGQQGKQRLALLAVAGSSEVAAEALALLSTPTIPPMTRQPLTNLLPDYVVLSVKEVRARGAGGFLAAGFWDYTWSYLQASAWEASCRQLAPDMEGARTAAGAASSTTERGPSAQREASGRAKQTMSETGKMSRGSAAGVEL